ncbi:MAG: C10 family peptidase [Bacteroidetes bacterium]|nr:C10 family peptidase [Bacteroidota bacterium]
MRKKKKNSIKTSLIAIASCLVLLLPFSCQEKPDAIPKNEFQIETNEFFIAENSAKMVAENFAKGFGSNTPNSLKTQKTYSLNNFLDEENGEALLYIVNYDEGGFIIIPADNRVYPILAHSEESSFVTVESEIPDGVNLWVHYTKKAIKKVKRENKKQNLEMEKIWKRHLKVTSLKVYDPPGPCEDETINVGPFLQTVWHQWVGFNDSLDILSGCTELPYNGRAFVGCVTVAMAQVMKYHQHPSSYSWSSMPNIYGTSATHLLIRDIGISNSMDYLCSGSETSTQTYVVPSLVNDFGYSSSATFVNNYNYITLKNELSNNRPVLMRADDDNGLGGHTWVCDGYQSRFYCDSGGSYLYFRMNWGFINGLCNAYYYSWNSSFDPLEFEFNTNLGMVIGIKP